MHRKSHFSVYDSHLMHRKVAFSVHESGNIQLNLLEI